MGQLALAVTEKEWDVHVFNFVFSKELTVVSFSFKCIFIKKARRTNTTKALFPNRAVKAHSFLTARY
jgi:hypothetical protein